MDNKDKYIKPYMRKALETQLGLDEQEEQLAQILNSVKFKTTVKKASILPECWFFVEKPQTLEFMRIDPASKLIKNHLLLDEDLCFHVIFSNKKQQKLDKRITSPNEIYEYLRSVERWPICVGTNVGKIEFSKKCQEVFVGDEVCNRYINLRCEHCRALRKKILTRKAYGRQLFSYKRYAESLNLKYNEMRQIINGKKTVRRPIKRSNTHRVSNLAQNLKSHNNLKNNASEISQTATHHTEIVFLQEDGCFTDDEDNMTLSSLLKKPDRSTSVSPCGQQARKTSKGQRSLGTTVEQVKLRQTLSQGLPRFPSGNNALLGQLQEVEALRMLIFLENGEERIITFTLPDDKCTLRDVLIKAGIKFSEDTNIQFIQRKRGDIDYFLAIGSTVHIEELLEKYGLLEESSPTASPTSSEGINTSKKSQCNKNVNKYPEIVKKLSAPSRYIYGMNSICKYCGFTGQDFSRCERCKRVFTEDPISLPIETVKLEGNIKMELETYVDENN